MAETELSQKLRDAIVDVINRSKVPDDLKQQLVQRVENLHKQGRLVEVAKREFMHEPEESEEDDDNDRQAKIDELKVEAYYQVLSSIRQAFLEQGQEPQEAFLQVLKLDNKVVEGEVEIEQVLEWVKGIVEQGDSEKPSPEVGQSVAGKVDDAAE